MAPQLVSCDLRAYISPFYTFFVALKDSCMHVDPHATWTLHSGKESRIMLPCHSPEQDTMFVLINSLANFYW